MTMKNPNVPASVASGLICLALGGATGFMVRDAQMQKPTPIPSAGGGMRPGGPGGGAPGGGGPGGGQGGAGAPNPGRDLTRLVSGLNTVEKAQSKGLTPAQKTQLLPLMLDIQKADTLPEADATAKLDAVKKVLTPDQQQMLADMQPQRGGRGGAGAGGAGGSGRPGGAPGGGGMAVMGGMGGPGGGGGAAQPDPNKLFASERNKKALDDLITSLK